MTLQHIVLFSFPRDLSAAETAQISDEASCHSP